MRVTIVELHCELTGNGPDLVLLHPVGLDHTFMGPFLAMAARGYRVIDVDLRGHGVRHPRSPPRISRIM